MKKIDRARIEFNDVARVAAPGVRVYQSPTADKSKSVTYGIRYINIVLFRWRK
jgi:hypothetical protein